MAEYVGKVKVDLAGRDRLDLWEEGRAMGLEDAVAYALSV